MNRALFLTFLLATTALVWITPASAAQCTGYVIGPGTTECNGPDSDADTGAGFGCGGAALVISYTPTPRTGCNGGDANHCEPQGSQAQLCHGYTGGSGCGGVVVVAGPNDCNGGDGGGEGATHGGDGGNGCNGTVIIALGGCNGGDAGTGSMADGQAGTGCSATIVVSTDGGCNAGSGGEPTRPDCEATLGYGTNCNTLKLPTLF